MPIDSHLPQADPFSLVPTFNETAQTDQNCEYLANKESKILKILRFDPLFERMQVWSMQKKFEKKLNPKISPEVML